MSAYDRLCAALGDAGSRMHTGSDQATAQCPAHEDRNASLSIRRSETGVLIKCHAGCATEDILSPLGMATRDLFDKPRDRSRGYAVTAEYPYRDESGNVLYVKERRFPKDFRQYRVAAGGRREYSLNGTRRVLYRLPDVLAAIRDGQPVWIAEGEKDVDSLVRAGVCATTWGDGAWRPGAAPKWRDDYTAALKGADVTIVGDDDDTGRNTAHDIAKSINGTASSVRVLFPATGKDVTDHLTAGGTLATLRQETPEPDATPTREMHRGQARMSERLVHEHGQDMRHVAALGWFFWDGARWAEDKDGEPTRRVLDTLRSAIHEAAESPGAGRTELLEDVRKCESASAIKGVLSISGDLKPVALAHDRLDASPTLLATPDGTLDLDTGRIRVHDRLDHITKLAGASPGDVGADLWDLFLTRVLPDREVRGFVQRLIGVAMLGEVREQILPILTGDGANGKGVFRDTILHAFGDYGLEVDPALLMESKHERHGTYKMQLRGRRLVFTSETEKGRRFAEATMKRLTGGDPINANLMHKDAITFNPSHLLCMVTNHLPEVSGDDPAIWRRIVVVPFDVVIPIEERDPELSRKLRDAAPAVLTWALDGWNSYRSEGLNPPDAVRARTAAYQASADVLARFIEERCLISPHARVKARELFDSFTTWCRCGGEVPPTEKSFAESMASRGYAKSKTGGVMVYRGLGLYAEGDDEVDNRRSA